MYTDAKSGAVATLLRNDDLHEMGIALNEEFRFVSKKERFSQRKNNLLI